MVIVIIYIAQNLYSKYQKVSIRSRVYNLPEIDLNIGRNKN
jgi:hypothetical protein